ncbi:hypothetical protein HHI36_012741 [Cryptolaemus montrouzieri]|uniref:Uncharacterized protein n=1 Tax=Cryptolaemus montrouzieri TaxID=559131 RepID=A0ABD2NGA9_9CUCU
MLKGLIILRQEWTDDIIKGTVKLLSEPVLENNIELSNGIKKATINHLMNKPKLFDGIKFYLEGPDDAININGLSITKDFLKLLISTGDGINLCRAPAPRTVEDFKTFPFHATTQSGVFGCSNIIIFNDNHPPKLQYKMQQLQHKSTKWLIDCIMNFTLT